MVARMPLNAEAVREALREVVDPEIPAVNIVDMGMVGAIALDDDGGVVVEIVPTFSGCPALAVIREDVVRRVGAMPGVQRAEARVSFEQAWSTDRISEAGRAALTRFGIAPAPLRRGKALEMAPPRPVRCPLCGSTRTSMENLFGPTPCRSIYRCQECRNPFEAFKAL